MTIFCCQLSGSRPVHILVATPGRFCELLHDDTVASLQDMSQLRFLIMDEADRMMEEGIFQLTLAFSPVL